MMKCGTLYQNLYVMASISDKAELGKNLYLDLVPSYVIENVVRMMSPSPRSEEWHSYLHLKEIMPLYHVAGAMGVFMRTLTTNFNLIENRSLFVTKVVTKPCYIEASD